MIACTHTTGSTSMPRPATGHTPRRSIRLGDEIWEQVEHVAALDGTTATGVVKAALMEYIAKRRRQERAERVRSKGAETEHGSSSSAQ